MQTLTRLQPNMIVLFEHREWRVVSVNESWARLVPVAKVTRVYVPQTGKDAGKRIQFQSFGAAVSVSPNSELPIVRMEVAR